MLPSWSPAAEAQKRDVNQARIAPAVTSGEYVCPGYERGSDPAQLQDLAPIAFAESDTLHGAPPRTRRRPPY